MTNRTELQQRIVSRMRIEDHGFSSPCWVSNRAKCRGGYTQFVYPGGRHTQTHRAAYELFVGDIPEGLVIDHLCRVPACCNPDHLEPVTHRTNMRRGTAPSAVTANTNRCKRGHELTADNTYRKRNGERNCLLCKRTASRNWYRAKAGIPADAPVRAYTNA